MASKECFDTEVKIGLAANVGEAAANRMFQALKEDLPGMADVLTVGEAIELAEFRMNA